MRRSATPSFGHNVFPSPTADRRGRQIQRTPFRRCQQCGLPYDTRITSWAPDGDGLGPSIDDSSTFYLVNQDIALRVQTTCSSVDGSIKVAPFGGTSGFGSFPASGYMLIGKELISYVAKSTAGGFTLFIGCTRGRNGTTAAGHSTNTRIQLVKAITSSASDHANISGCRLCATQQVARNKPQPLPDDRNFPSDEFRNYKRRRR